MAGWKSSSPLCNMRASARRLARSAMLMSDIRTVRSRPSLSSPRVVRSFFSTSLRHSLAPQSFPKNVRCQGIHGVFSNTSLGHLIDREVQPVYRSLPANPPSSPPKQLSTNFLKVSALQRLHGIQVRFPILEILMLQYHILFDTS